MNRRRGFSLVELLVVMVVGSVVMGIAVTLLYTLLRAHGAAESQVRRCMLVSRLADQFRRDVHAASAHRSSEPAGWQFTFAAGRTVTYRAEDGRLVRTLQNGQAVQQRESFPLPPDMNASIVGEDEDSLTIVSLVIAPATETDGPSPRRTIRIDALPARDHRFANTKASPNNDDNPDG